MIKYLYTKTQYQLSFRKGSMFSYQGVAMRSSMLLLLRCIIRNHQRMVEFSRFKYCRMKVWNTRFKIILVFSTASMTLYLRMKMVKSLPANDELDYESDSWFDWKQEGAVMKMTVWTFFRWTYIVIPLVQNSALNTSFAIPPPAPAVPKARTGTNVRIVYTALNCWNVSRLLPKTYFGAHIAV